MKQVFFSRYANLEKSLEFIINQMDSKCYFITDGKNGSYVIYQGNIKKISCNYVNAIDDVGAGDAYFATILFNIDVNNININELVKIAKIASELSSFSTKYVGTINAFQKVLIEKS